MSKQQVIRRLPEVTLVFGFTLGFCYGYSLDQWPWMGLILPLVLYRLWQWSKLFKKIADAEEKS